MDWIELYQQELGIDATSRQDLLTAVSKDITAAARGDKAAKRRVAAYNRADRTFEKRINATDREAAEDEDAEAESN